MSKDNKVKFLGNASFLAKINLAEGENGVFELPTEIQLARTGTFFRLWSDGDVYEDIPLTKEMFESFVKNFDDYVTGIDLAIDFSHDTWDKAGAWIKSLFLRESKDFPGQMELMSVPRYTKSGMESISGGDFRYLSIEFHTNYRNNNTLAFHGPTLLGAGFTNRPVIKNMKPTSKLSEKAAIKEKEKMDIKELESKNAKLSEEIKTSTEAITKLSRENKTLKEENEKLLSEKKNSEKNASFDKKLSEGTVCEAQREHYLSGDMDKFMGASQKPLNLDEQGSGQAPTGDEGQDDQDKILAEAKKLCEKNEGMTISEAIIKVQNK